MKRFAWNAFLLITPMLIVLMLQGCASRQLKPIEFSLLSVADGDLNQDADGRPLSVVLVIYQLREPSHFSRLTFEQYVSGRDDAELFGDSIVARSEHVVLPANRQQLPQALVPDAAYLGIVAVYRNPAARHWRYLIAADELHTSGFWPFSREKTLEVHLHKCHMRISGVSVDWIPGQQAIEQPGCSSERKDSADVLAVERSQLMSFPQR